MLGYWQSAAQTDPRVVDLFSRHYSARQLRGRKKWLQFGIAGPGKVMCLLGVDSRAIFIWRKTIYRFLQAGFRKCGMSSKGLLVLEQPAPTSQSLPLVTGQKRTQV